MMCHLGNYPSRLILAIVGQKEQIKKIDMKEKEFVEKVIKMRNAQKAFFQSKSPSFLSEAKRLEREVDKMIDRIIDEEKNPSLKFD